jgi:hypothetical protein
MAEDKVLRALEIASDVGTLALAGSFVNYLIAAGSTIEERSMQQAEQKMYKAVKYLYWGIAASIGTTVTLYLYKLNRKQ